MPSNKRVWGSVQSVGDIHVSSIWESDLPHEFACHETLHREILGATGHLYFPGAHQDYCRQKPTTSVDWIKVTSEGVEMGGQHTFQPQNVSVPTVCWCKQQVCSISHPIHALTHLSKMLEFMQWSHIPPSKAL